MSTIRIAPWLTECHLNELPWTESLNDVKSKMYSFKISTCRALFCLTWTPHAVETSSVPRQGKHHGTAYVTRISEKLSKCLYRIKANNIVFPENISERQSLWSPTLNRVCHLGLESDFVQKTGLIKTSQTTQDWWHGHNMACDWGTIRSRNVQMSIEEIFFGNRNRARNKVPAQTQPYKWLGGFP